MDEKPMPKYRKLKALILEWLSNGRLRPHDKMPSEHDLAREFGISRQTVRQAFGELESEGWLYRAQGKGTFVASRTRGRQEPGTVGILTTYISDYIFPHIVRGAESALRERGYRLLLSSTDNNKDKERDNLRMLLEQPLSGLIIEPTKSAQGNPNLSYFLSLNYRKLPYLMINERYPEMDCPCLKADDELGGFKAAEYLIGLGHRDIAGLFKTDDMQGVNRLKGFIRAHQHYGIPLNPDRVVHYQTEEKLVKPRMAVQAMLGETGKPTALVCYNDELAVQMLEPIRQAGLLVPEHISIIGFDDSTWAEATETKLTTLTHPKSQMGRDAAQLLIRMIEEPDAAAAILPGKVYRPELLVRGSTGSVPV